ncbi:MAG: hypothetical protein RLZZ399_839 [Verrucomicrobiota bacterium]
MGDDVSEAHGKLDGDFLGAFSREHVDDAGNAASGVACVQGGEDEVSCLGGGKCEGDGFAVAHFADDDDIGIFA